MGFGHKDLKEDLIKYSAASWDALRERASAAKAACLALPNGTAEAVPYPKLSGNELNQRFLKGLCHAASGMLFRRANNSNPA